MMRTEASAHRKLTKTMRGFIHFNINSIYHRSNVSYNQVFINKIFQNISGFKKKDIESCMKWMCPFVDILAAELYLEVASFSQISSDLAHNIQTHVISISLLVSI